MTYPGNPSLSAAVKDRVVSTFQQTLALHQQGRTDEVVAGCNLLLQMDPLFDPAKKLLEKTRNPSLPIDVTTLLPPRDLRAPLEQAVEALAARDFQRVISLTSEILSDDMFNEDARALGDDARERMEAGPFVEQFARKCEQHIAAGNFRAARAELDKARALDETHPQVARVAKAIAAAETAVAKTGASPSFIVEESAQPATGRPASQASDFGFTFEEEKSPQPFSFDSPSSDSPFSSFSFGAPAAAPAAAPSGPPDEFDFTTASVSTTPDDQKKIEQYLADGDRAFDGGDYQQAIDLWSRIFLIDVTNEPASDRIEQAKAKRRDIDQKIDPLLVSAVDAFERGDKARARTGFTEVLRIDPRNTTAQDYLDQIGEGVEGGAAAASNPYIPPSTQADKVALDFFDDEPLVPPPPSATAAVRKAPPAKVTAGPSRTIPVGPIAIVLAILVLGAGGWYAWQRFMNKPDAAPAATADTVFARVATLAARGKYDQAIALLQDIQPGHPQHDKALEMIADLQKQKSTTGQLVDGKTPEQVFAEKIAAGRVAFEAHDYAGAKTAFEEAIKINALPAEAKTLYDTAAAQVAKLDSAKTMFTERKYADVIATLQPLLEQDPQNQNIRRMIVDARFNLGALALQDNPPRTEDAIREFDEVLKANPNDELAKRSRDLAVRYNGEAKDLLYKIYVKYLPLRQAV